MAKQAEPAATLNVARIIIDNKDPVEFTAATTHALTAAIAAWCRDYWNNRRRYATDDFPATPPADDAEAITIYFHEADGESLESAAVSLEPLPDIGALSEEELITAYESVDAVAQTVLAQRATIGRAILHRIEARQTPDAEQPLNPTDQRRVKRLLSGIVIEEAARHRAEHDALEQARADLRPGEPADADLADKTDQQIAEEVLHQQFERRIRWSSEQLERILALNEQSPEPLAPDERALREAVSVTARALIDARRAPKTGNDPAGTTAQVAYLLPVEVVIDLDEQRVKQVVAIDEALELDPVEGARAETTLKPLTPNRATRAVAIAERAPWPAPRFGF